MGQAASDGAAGADGLVADKRQGLGEQRDLAGQGLGPFGGLLSHHGADVDVVVVEIERRQVVELVEIDEDRGPGQAERHHRDQALATRKGSGLVAVLSHDRQRFLERLGKPVVKRRRFQDPAA